MTIPRNRRRSSSRWASLAPRRRVLAAIAAVAVLIATAAAIGSATGRTSNQQSTGGSPKGSGASTQGSEASTQGAAGGSSASVAATEPSADGGSAPDPRAIGKTVQAKIIRTGSVEVAVAKVQGELEQLQGRKQLLDDQTALSTITVNVSERGAKRAIIEPEPDRRGLARVWHDSMDRFNGGARAITVGFAAMAPWLLLVAVLWVPVRWLWRRTQETPAPPPPAAT